MLNNVNGITNSGKTAKSNSIREFIKTKSIDIHGWTEINAHLASLPPTERLHERTKEWFPDKPHISQSYFHEYNPQTWYQRGGVAQLTMGDTVAYKIEQGNDPLKLGRWCWTRYKGKEELHLTVFTAYVPTLNKKDLHSTYSQQVWFFHEKKAKDVCPRKEMIDNLCTAVKSAVDRGDQVIVMLDANQDVRDSYLQAKLSGTNIGLWEINIYKHGNDAPPTYNRGSEPIDGIFVSPCLAHSAKCGYLSFGDAPLNCDHRTLWLDIPKDVVFGCNVQTPQSIPTRLKCIDPRIVKKHNEIYNKFLNEHNLFSRASCLQQQVDNGPTTPAIIKEWNEIDKLRIKGLKKAGRNCRKLRMGNLPWSPALGKARIRVHGWGLIRKKSKAKRNKKLHLNNRYVRRTLKKAEIPLAALKSNEEKAEKEYRSALKALRKFGKKAEASRFSFLEGLAEEIARKEDLKKEKVLKQLRAREKQRTDSRIIKRSRNKLQSSCGITKVIGPGPDGTGRVEYSTKEEMEQVIMDQNTARFWQANAMPPLNPPFSDKVGFLAEGPGAEEILSTGKLTLNEGDPPLDEYLEKLLTHLKRPDNVPTLSLWDVRITKEKHIHSWSKAKEKTSSGGTDTHFGQCIATSRHDDLAEFEATMRNIPFVGGFAPDRYKECDDFELLKKPGNYNVEDLRTIRLFECMYNDNNKIMGRQTMHHAEKHHLLAPEQYGSRKDRAAITQYLNSILVDDLFRQTRLSGAKGSNDAKSCFDRIVHNIAMLCMECLGCPKEPLISSFKTLQEMKAFIKTLFGRSVSFYDGSNEDKPISTLGQGNGAGPQIWAAVSTPILKLMAADGHGILFFTAMTGDKVELVGFCFVDDTDLAVTVRGHPTQSAVEEAVSRMQASFDTWIGGLHATGGAISAKKSYWTLIHFLFDEDGKWRYATSQDFDAEIWITDYDGDRKILTRAEPSTGNKMLGVRSSVDGTSKDEFKHRRQQAQEWRDSVRTGHLPRHLTWTSMQTTVMKQLEYPLPATSFTRKECDSIMAPVMQAGLSHSGIVNKVPKAIRFGPAGRQGFGIHDMFVTQGIDHFVRLVDHGYNKQDLTGSLIRATCQQLILELGTPDKLFQHSYAKYHTIATECWIKSTWQFADFYGITIDTDLPTLQPQCPGDVFLIPLFQQQDDELLEQLSICRTYLQVTTLADLLTADGKCIRKSIWEGKREETKYNNYHWARQERPKEKHWKTFRAALDQAFTVHDSTRAIANPLTSWTTTYEDWPFYYDEYNERLYSKDEDKWKVYGRSNRNTSRGNRMTFSNTAIDSLDDLPPTAKHATVDTTATKFYVSGVSSQPRTHHEHQPLAPPDQDDLQAFIHHLHQLPIEQRWGWASLEIDENIESLRPLVQSIKDGLCRAVSDGSTKEDRGTSSWILRDLKNQTDIKGKNVIPGPLECQDSYRSELGGLYGLVFFITTLLEYFYRDQATLVKGQITNVLGLVHIGCDGESAITQCYDEEKHITSKHTSHDLIIAIRQRMHEFPNLTWVAGHIKGHQDDHVDYEDLDMWAQMNCDMDAGAKAFWSDTYTTLTDPPSHNISHSPWTTRINGHMIVIDFKQSIRDFCSGTDLLQYWDEKQHRYGSKTADDIDWESLEKAMHSMSQSYRREATKHASGFFGTGKNMVRWKKRKTDNCPRCKAPKEDKTHIIKCPDPEATKLFDEKMTELNEWLDNQETEIGIQTIIIDRLKNWRNNTQCDNEDLDPNDPLTPAVLEQDEIGWESAFTGLWAKGWAEAQLRHFESIWKPTHRQRWLAALIKKLFQISWDMWEHRNGIMFNTDKSILLDAEKQEVREQIAAGFNHFPRALSELIKIPAATIFKMKPLARRAWLRHIKAARTVAENGPSARE